MSNYITEAQAMSDNYDDEKKNKKEFLNMIYEDEFSDDGYDSDGYSPDDC